MDQHRNSLPSVGNFGTGELALMASWHVEPDMDGRYAFLAYREDDRKATLLQIPFTTPPWNDAYIWMSRQAAIHMKTFIDHIVNENTTLKRALEAYQSANRMHNDSESELWEQGELALGRELP